MIGITKIIGKYNVDYAGEVYDGNQKYQMIIIIEFDDENEEVDKKVFYFKDRAPNLTGEYQIEHLYNSFPNRCKLVIAPTTLICRI